MSIVSGIDTESISLLCRRGVIVHHNHV